MTRSRMTTMAVALAALSLALTAGTAGAAIDSVSGQIEWLHSPPASVQPGALSSETVMRAFDERQHVTLTTPLAVNISQPGTYKLVADETPATIPAGTVVDSHFVHVDKDTQFSTILTGTIHLDSDVIGIVLDNAAAQTLDASDLLGFPATLYPAPLLFGRGFELNTNQQDEIVVHADRRTVDITSDIRLQLVDQLRIITLAAAPPVVDAGPPAAGAEGSAIALSGSVGDPDTPSPTISWSYAALSGVDAGATCSFADPASPSTTITCTDDGVYTATLTASDGENAPVSDSTTVTVSNATPVVTITSPAAGSYLPGATIPLSASFTDAGSNDTHTCTIDWGDGSTVDPGTVSESSGSGTCTGSHAYAVSSSGSRTITVRVTDDDGATGQATATLSIFSARSLKQDAIDRANALIPGARKPDADKLNDVVGEITASLDPSRWGVDDNHVSETKGQEVFDHEKKAVTKLMNLLKGHTIPDSSLQPIVDDLLNADLFIAQTEIDDAIAAHGDPTKIGQAQDELAKAADERSKGHYDKAVDHFEHAWEHARDAF
jgi:hypothetical protein